MLSGELCDPHVYLYILSGELCEAYVKYFEESFGIDALQPPISTN